MHLTLPRFGDTICMNYTYEIFRRKKRRGYTNIYQVHGFNEALFTQACAVGHAAGKPYRLRHDLIKAFAFLAADFLALRSMT